MDGVTVGERSSGQTDSYSTTGTTRCSSIRPAYDEDASAAAHPCGHLAHTTPRLHQPPAAIRQGAGAFLRPCLRRLWRSRCADWDPQAERQRKSTRVAVLHDHARLIEHASRAQDSGGIAHRGASSRCCPGSTLENDALSKRCSGCSSAGVRACFWKDARRQSRCIALATWGPSVQLATTLEPPAGLSICDTTRQTHEDCAASVPIGSIAALQRRRGTKTNP
jgi:hypothetical protein